MTGVDAQGPLAWFEAKDFFHTCGEHSPHLVVGRKRHNCDLNLKPMLLPTEPLLVVHNPKSRSQTAQNGRPMTFQQKYYNTYKLAIVNILVKLKTLH